MDIPCIYILYYIHILIIYHVYPEYIPGIYLRYTIHIPGIYIEYTIHMYCICKVYTKDKQCSKYNEYVWYITGISHPDWYMHGIYMVYTWYIHGIFHPYGVLINMYGIYHVKHLWVCSVPFFILIYVWYIRYILWIYHEIRDIERKRTTKICDQGHKDLEICDRQQYNHEIRD